MWWQRDELASSAAPGGAGTEIQVEKTQQRVAFATEG
jgi:hypothetical protein